MTATFSHSNIAENTAVEPFRVGLIGLNRQGWHLIEQCLNGGPFRVVISINAESANASCDIDAVVTSPEIDVAWIAHPIALQPEGLPSSLIERLLIHGKHVVAEAPMSLSFPEADRLMAIAHQHGCRLLVHSPRHADENIRKTLAAVNSEEQGVILAAKWISWSYAIPPAAVSEQFVSKQSDEPESPSEDLYLVLVRQVVHVLDQLVQLIPTAPRRVFAARDLFCKTGANFSPTFATWIEFTNGARAEIDIRLNSPVPLHTGWVIHSERGGVTGGQQFKLTADGEIFDSPMPASAPADNDLVSLAKALRGQPSDSQTPTQTLATVRLLDAIRQSSHMSQQD